MPPTVFRPQPGQRILVVIPAYNERETIGPVVRDLFATLEGVEVLVVDDGSADDTAIQARDAGATVARLPYNLGIGGALRTGFRYAERHDVDVVVQFDADGQHVSSEIKLLLEEIDDGADLVIGSRFLAQSDYDVGRVRRAAMALLRGTLSLLTKQNFTDTSSGFRAMSRETIHLFASSYPTEYMDSVEALLAACNSGLDVREVAVEMNQRAGGTPSNAGMKLAYHYLRVLVVLLSRWGHSERNAR